jgi:hypothetical protein
MVFNTGLILCVSAAVGGLAVLDPWFGVSAAGGAVTAGLILYTLSRRLEPAPAGETVGGLHSTGQDGDDVSDEERYFKPVRLVTAKYMGLEDGWEDELLVAGR